MDGRDADRFQLDYRWTGSTRLLEPESEDARSAAVGAAGRSCRSRCSGSNKAHSS